MKQSSVSVLFFLAVLLVVAYPSPAQGLGRAHRANE